MGTVAALNPVNVAIKSSQAWITADNADSAGITVMVTDGANKPIGGASIVLGVTQPWSLRDTAGTTTAGGQFVTEFLPTTTSGTALITATVSVPGVTTTPVVQTYSQNINADIPAQATDSYPNGASVGAVIGITVRLTDQYGNPVTSKMKATFVNFSTTFGGENAFLVQDPGNARNKIMAKNLSVALNDSGYAQVNYTLDTRPGDNFVLVNLPAPLSATLINIQGIANLPPSSLSQAVTPGGNPPSLFADGRSRFTIHYQLFDRYGNPSTYHTLSISSSAGELVNISSNSEGNVTITYGPKNAPGDYTITATALDNPVIRATQTLRFTSEDPTGMLLTASPQSMASSDQNNQSVSTVLAKVTDTSGNPVQGQMVSFSIQGVDVGSFVQTSEPAIEGSTSTTNVIGTEVTAVTDSDGFATVQFYPGAFTTDLDLPGYSATAEGIAIIGARWSVFTRTINLSYKNYPYLSVSTSVKPKTVATNGTVDVSIRVRGDGYLLQPRPVDVVLATDRSGSMGKDTPTRISQVQGASKTFVAQLDYAKDRVGLVSFGQDISVDEHLSGSPSAINSTIDAMIASGYTPMREALYDAVNEINANRRTGTIKAIILLTDGDYNWYGDPLARGPPSSKDPSDFSDLELDYIPMANVPSQNMAVYAKANNIRVYTIGFATDISQGGEDTLRQIAAITSGRYFYAPTGGDLNSIYTQIAGDLKDTAGVNTTMDLNFQTAEVNGVPTSGSGVFEYVYSPGSSTYIVPPPPASPWTENSTAAWNTDQRLSFDLGTIKVNQEWLVNFTLKIVKSGDIRILGYPSRVIFDDGKESLTIPDAYVTAFSEGMVNGLAGISLQIKNLRRTNPDSDRNSASVAWDIAYNGFDPNIREEIQIAPLNSAAYTYRGTTWAAKDDTTGTYTLDISGLQPGSYKVRVIGFVSDADSSWAEATITIPAPEEKPEILIQ